MLVLFDNGTPRTLARYLIDRRTVTEAPSHGWAELENGELLSKAEEAGFEVFVTTDKNISYQATNPKLRELTKKNYLIWLPSGLA